MPLGFKQSLAFYPRVFAVFNQGRRTGRGASVLAEDKVMSGPKTLLKCRIPVTRSVSVAWMRCRPCRHRPLPAQSTAPLGVDIGASYVATEGGRSDAGEGKRSRKKDRVARDHITGLWESVMPAFAGMTGMPLSHSCSETDAYNAANVLSPAFCLLSANTAAASFSTAVPLKKCGLAVPQKRTALANVKSRKSFSLTKPSSSSS